MVSVYSTKRREPRVKLNAPVVVTVSDEDGSSSAFETSTIDVSPHGASVRLETPLSIGSIVRFAAKRYNFATRAVVRSAYLDRSLGGYSVGLEYLDRMNPLVVWQKCGGELSLGDA